MSLAQTPVNRAQANAYFSSCMQGESPIISRASQEMLCSCTSAYMLERLSVEDVEAMSRQDESARPAFNKMLINVYAPCMEAPARDYYYNTCMTEQQGTGLSANPEALCGCMAAEVAGYLQQNGPALFREILHRNPDAVDPMQALTGDPEFLRFAQDRLLRCYQNNR